MLGKSGRLGGWWRKAPQAIVPVLRARIARERAAIGAFNDTLERSLQSQVSESALRAVQVALDELLTNVIMHAEQAAGPIEVEIVREQNIVATTISYIADEFDPTSWRPAPRGTTVAAARVGGLGIQMVRTLMDEFSYAYDAGRNVVTLRKRC
jgi:anti-sigma regulatory factor (Ser/Thr protein kinase)